jgi:putative salt-induced outer membrane protein
MRAAYPLLAFVLAFAPIAARAYDSDDFMEDVGQFGGTVALGSVSTTGSTQTRSVNGKLNLDYKPDPWKNAFQFAAINTSGNGPGADRQSLSDKLDYSFITGDFAFALVEYDNDRFGGVRIRRAASVGYGRHVLSGEWQTLDVDTGLGWREEVANGTLNATSDAIVHSDLKYQLRLAERARFAETAKFEPSRRNQLFESVTELKLPIYGALSATLSYTVRHNSRVAPPLQKTDTATAVTFAYSFGAVDELK